VTGSDVILRLYQGFMKALFSSIAIPIDMPRMRLRILLKQPKKKSGSREVGICGFLFFRASLRHVIALKRECDG
jgi:hypothetical protein